jgi:hypothetical protein
MLKRNKNKVLKNNIENAYKMFIQIKLYKLSY